MAIIVDYTTFKAQTAGLINIQVYYIIDPTGGFVALATQSSLGEPLAYQGEQPPTFMVDFPSAVLAQSLNLGG